MNEAETPMALALSGLSFMMTVIWGTPFIRFLRHFRVGKIIRVEGPQSHMTKMGIPTMGGIMFIMPIVMLFLLGYAATNDVRNVPLAVLDQDHTARSRELVEKFIAAGRFRVTERLSSAAEVSNRIPFTVTLPVAASTPLVVMVAVGGGPPPVPANGAAGSPGRS